MSIAYSLAQRTPSLNSLFAGLACAAALALTAGPALAQGSDLERVEVHGRVVEAPARYDVHANCTDLADQLVRPLTKTWLREGRYGEVNVQFVMENGSISAVDAKGISNAVARDVRAAVKRLECGPQTTADARIYRFQVAFINPYAKSNGLQTAGRANGTQVAIIGR